MTCIMKLRTNNNCCIVLICSKFSLVYLELYYFVSEAAKPCVYNLFMTRMAANSF